MSQWVWFIVKAKVISFIHTQDIIYEVIEYIAGSVR